MGFHNKGLPLLVKGKSGGCGVLEVNSNGKESGNSNSAQDSVPGNSRGGGEGEGRDFGLRLVKDLSILRSSGKDKDKEMTMIEKKIKIIEDLEAFQQALPLFSSMEHHAVHISISEDGEPTLFECVCGEEVLKEIQFLRHLLYELGALDLRSLSFFVKSKIEILTGKQQAQGKDQLQMSQKKNCDQPLPSTSAATAAACIVKTGGEEEDVVQPSLAQDQDLVENEAETSEATTSTSHSKKEKKKKKGHGHHNHGSGKSKKSSHDKKLKLKKKNPKNFYWQKRNGHGIKAKIHAGENQGKFVCYCGNIFKRLSSIDHHVSKKWNKKDYKCEEDGCDQVYQSKFRLKLHFQKNHQSESSAQPEAEPVYSIAAVAASDTATVSVQNAVALPALAPTSSPGSARARPAPAKLKKKKKVNNNVVAKAKAKKAAAVLKNKTPAVRVSMRRKVWENKEQKEKEEEPKTETAVEETPPQKLQMVCPRDGCGKIFISKKGLRLHVQAQHDKIPVICKKCGMDVKYETCLLPHQRSNKCKPTKQKPKVVEKKDKEKAAILSLLGKDTEESTNLQPLSLVKKDKIENMEVDSAPGVSNSAPISELSSTISAPGGSSITLNEDPDSVMAKQKQPT